MPETEFSFSIFSPRQNEMLRLLMSGLTRKQIRKQVTANASTISATFRAMQEKTGVYSDEALVALAKSVQEGSSPQPTYNRPPTARDAGVCSTLGRGYKRTPVDCETVLFSRTHR